MRAFQAMVLATLLHHVGKFLMRGQARTIRTSIESEFPLEQTDPALRPNPEAVQAGEPWWYHADRLVPTKRSVLVLQSGSLYSAARLPAPITGSTSDSIHLPLPN